MAEAILLTGVYIDRHASQLSLWKTLYFLVLNMSESDAVLLFFDGTSEGIPKELLDTVAAFSHHSIVVNESIEGRAFCFNQLVDEKADCYLFLECGVLLAPGCLEALRTPFAQQNCGITSPSSNNCWNEQALFQDENPGTIDWSERPAQIQARFGSAPKMPFNALVEYCFIVGHALVEAIGFADPCYGTGYCWEIDYQKRAQLAGFDVCWIRTSYAHRSSLPNGCPRGQSFEQNAEYLKAKFEGASLALPKLNKEMLKGRQQPLVSCIMPTAGRPHFVAKAIDYFHRQDYPNTELIIVYDELGDLPKVIHNKGNIRTVPAPVGGSIGHKRNLACREARGSIIAHWDDDDWYAKDRLSRQVAPLLLDDMDISALNNTGFFAPVTWSLWATSSALYEEMFIQGVHGGTLVYKRAWSERVAFHDISLREDALFLSVCIQKGAKLAKIDGLDLFLYLRHGGNSWEFEAGSFSKPGEWKPGKFPKSFCQDSYFYYSTFKEQLFGSNRVSAERLAAIKVEVHHSPTVSCIMPTWNRRRFVPLALRYFLRQSYPKVELVIVDDGDEPIVDLLAGLPEQALEKIKYIRLKERHSVGEKRNIAIENASGEIIQHWDDDDWIGSEWVESQVENLIESGADIGGIGEAYYFSLENGSAWKYIYSNEGKPWVLGGSMCYDKVYWETRRFKGQDIGEDSDFIWRGPPAILAAHEGIEGYVGMVHSNNVSPKQTAGLNWHLLRENTIQKLLGPDLNDYQMDLV